jgi:hypothetical protein
VAEDGTFAGGEDGRDPDAAAGQLAMTDRVHATVDDVQAPTLEKPRDRVPTEKVRELAPGDDSMLPPCEGRHGRPRVTRDFDRIIRLKSRVVSHAIA